MSRHDVGQFTFQVEVGSMLTIPRPATGTLSGKVPIRVEIYCGRCLLDWVSYPGNKPGEFIRYLNSIALSCPQCGAECEIHNSQYS